MVSKEKRAMNILIQKQLNKVPVLSVNYREMGSYFSNPTIVFGFCSFFLMRLWCKRWGGESRGCCLSVWSALGT